MKTNKKIVGAMAVFVMSFLATNATCSAEDVVTTSTTVNNIASNAGIAYSKLNLTGKIVSADIKDSTITGRDIKHGAVSSRDIKDRTITSIDIEKGAIKSGSIADDSIGNDKLKEDAVTSDKIQDGTIMNADINSAAAIDGAKINPNFGSQDIITSGIGNFGGGAELNGGYAAGSGVSIGIGGGGSIAARGNLAVDNDITMFGSALEVPYGNIELGGSMDIRQNIFNGENSGTDRLILGDGADDNVYIQSAFLSDTSGIVDIGDYNTMTDTVNLNGTANVNGDLTGTGTIGTSLSAWSTIYADNMDTSAIYNGAGTTLTIGNGDDTILYNGNIDMSGYIITDNTNIVTVGDGTDDLITLDGATDVQGDLTGTGTLGTTGSRWSTIYADNLNFKNTLTDTALTNSTINFGNGNDAVINIGDDSMLDTVNVVGITGIAAHFWGVDPDGNASFVSVGSSNPGTGAFTTLSATGALTTGDITAYGATANNDLTVNGKGTGSVNLGDADSDVSVINALTIGNSATITAGGLTITAGGLDMTGDSITNVTQVGDSNDNLAVTGDDWDVTDAGVATFKGLTSTGAVDLDGASSVDMPAATLGAACTVSGAIGVNPAGNVGERIMVCDGANWLAN